MRTTIEMKPEHRARLLELAASKGEKGFSNVISEALELYLESQKSRQHAIEVALSLKGSMSAPEAAALLAETQDLRTHWR